MKTFFRYVLPAMIFLSGVSIVAWYVTVIQPRPPVEGTVELPGLSQPVRIHWDAHGVPHIEAGTEEDLYMAVGYVHARDRLWQLTLNQLILEGRFAEFFGEEALPWTDSAGRWAFSEPPRRLNGRPPPSSSGCWMPTPGASTPM